MDLVDYSMIFVVAHLLAMGVGATPGTSWWKVVTFLLYLPVPAWYAWATGLWPFYLITLVLFIVFTTVVVFNMGKAYNDTND